MKLTSTVRIRSARKRVSRPLTSSSGRQTAGWALVEVGTMVATLHAMAPGAEHHAETSSPLLVTSLGVAEVDAVDGAPDHQASFSSLRLLCNCSTGRTL